MIRKAIGVASLLALSSSVVLGANPFATADVEFAKRGTLSGLQDFEQTTRTRNAYKTVLGQGNLSVEQRTYAVAQIGRLDLYRGMMIPGLEVTPRKEALKACVADMDLIESTKSQQFYYHKLSCMAALGKLSGLIDRANLAVRMRLMQGDALASSRDANGNYFGGYEGGGLMRVMSAVRSNLRAKAVGLYNADEGLQYSQVAIAARATSLPPYKEKYTGADFTENHFYLAFAQAAKGLEAGDRNLVFNSALGTVSDAIEEADELLQSPHERAPEMRHYLNQMRQFQTGLNNCNNNDRWQPCLETVLGE